MTCRIQIYSPYSLDPIHPRLEMIRRILTEHGYSVGIVTPRKTALSRRVNRLVLNFFDLTSFVWAWRSLRSADLIYVQDLRLLPLVVLAKLFGKPVLYETLDQNVSLHFYYWSQKYSFLRKATFLPRGFERLETGLARRFADAVLVNSRALQAYFQGKAEFLPYASPLEANGSRPATNLPCALLYLGAFTHDKGADDMIDLQKRLPAPLYIFGTVNDENLRRQIQTQPDIHLQDRIASTLLRTAIEELRRKYTLFGLSLIRPVHHSYATQEANKDIDYLALGIPLIGNHRKPTEEKIRAGCGLFAENISEIQKVFQQPRLRAALSGRCLRYYQQQYSQDTFTKKLLTIISAVCP